MIIKHIERWNRAQNQRRPIKTIYKQLIFVKGPDDVISLQIQHPGYPFWIIFYETLLDHFFS